MKKLKTILNQTFVNLFGWKTNRKIVVFESDDWGSIRTPSAEVNKLLKGYGYNIDKCHYMKYDSLESEDDIELLFDILGSIKTNKGQNPVITANCLVANPDFKKIEESNFNYYIYEKVSNTFSSYPNHKKVLNYWNEGVKKNIFKLQLHGREHLNISRWMRELQNNDNESHLMFKLKTFGISTHISKRKRSSFLAAFDGGGKELIFNRTQIVNDAFNIFKELLGYSPTSFIAPNYVWDESIENSLKTNGVKFIQSQRTQLKSSEYGLKRTLKKHYLGQTNKFGQIYLMRNCEYEPSSNQNIDWLDKCLHDIKVAFSWNKPAIICTHRVNFMGFIDKRNRDNTLRQFKNLLESIILKWPDVEFLSSDELGNLILNGK